MPTLANPTVPDQLWTLLEPLPPPRTRCRTRCALRPPLRELGQPAASGGPSLRRAARPGIPGWSEQAGASVPFDGKSNALLIIPLIIQTTRLHPSGSDQIDTAPNG